MADIQFSRVWAMPTHRTFQIKPITALIDKHLTSPSIDPFANLARRADTTNDIDPSHQCDYALDAVEFCELFADNSVECVLFDPPYSVRQVSECYTRMGRTVTATDTSASFWSRAKAQVSRVVRPGGVVIAFGWNSGGIGKKYGFELIEILLVPHGGAHNDTICTVERKRK
jgi:hypothetical protein